MEARAPGMEKGSGDCKLRNCKVALMHSTGTLYTACANAGRGPVFMPLVTDNQCKRRKHSFENPWRNLCFFDTYYIVFFI